MTDAKDADARQQKVIQRFVVVDGDGEPIPGETHETGTEAIQARVRIMEGDHPDVEDPNATVEILDND